MAATAITTFATLSLYSSLSSQCRLFSTRSQSTLLSLPKPLAAAAAATSLFSSTKPCIPALRASSSVIEFDPEAPPVGAEAEVSVDETRHQPRSARRYSQLSEVGSRQYIVIPGRYVTTQRLKGANVNDKGLNPKVSVFKYEKKKNRRNIGHQQPNTRIRVTGITGYEDYPAVTLASLGLAEAA